MGKKIVVICLMLFAFFIPIECSASTTDNQAVVSFYSDDQPPDPSGSQDSSQADRLPQTGTTSAKNIRLFGLLLFFLALLGWDYRKRRSKNNPS